MLVGLDWDLVGCGWDELAGFCPDELTGLAFAVVVRLVPLIGFVFSGADAAG